jgi:hypothetical protein
MERQKFEESFRRIFEKAESSPSDKVWTNIELDLERLERGNMKRRLTFFKFLAAASVIFALGVAGTGIYLLSSNRDTQPDRTTRHTAAPSDASALSGDSSADSQPADPDARITELPSGTSRPNEDSHADDPADADETEARNTLAERSEPATKNEGTTTGTPTGTAADLGEAVAIIAGRDIPAAASDQPVGEGGLEAGLTPSNGGRASSIGGRTPVFRDRPLPALVQDRKIVPHFPKTEPDQIDLLLASIEMEEKAAAGKKKFEDEKIWTSVGFSAGTFNNYNQGAAPSSLAMAQTGMMNLYSANATLASETQASGVSYSVGVNVGGKIAPRWVIQGGLNYMTQNAAFTSDAVVTADYQNFKAAYSAEITKMSDASARVVPTAPYRVNNNLEYLSIPLQAGYILVNRSFGLQINGGIATDLFLQNTLQPQSGNLDKVTNGRGSDSPYRPLNFSGLVGTEISYRFSDNYRVSLNPGVRYPFGSIYKSGLGLTAIPVTFDVGLRFRYIFE